MTWQLGSTLLVLAALAAGVVWYERSRPSSKLVSLVAALAALAVGGRVLFAAVPNVQATTDIVLLSGYALGAGPGFAVGAVGGLISNFFLGQGPWTPWQMAGWGAVGLLGAGLARGGSLGRWPLALACALAGFAFGAWMDLFTLLNFAAERSPDTYLAVAAAGLPFNVAHAVGNAVLCLLLGPAFVNLLVRFRRRFEIRWGPELPPARAKEPLLGDGRANAARTTALGLLLVALVLPLAPERAEGASPVGAAIRYLERAQNRDGGFGTAPGEASNQLMTGWTVIGLETAGRNPLDVRRAGRSPFAFIRRKTAEVSDVGELERTILALRGAGLSARRFGGRDLVAELLRRRHADGSFAGRVNHTAFAVLALRAAGHPSDARVVKRAAAWLAGQQNADGGFSFSGRGGASDVDDAGAALQALASAGRSRSKTVERVLSYFRKTQNEDGGFGQLVGSRSNAQSTAWAVQGLVAIGKAPARFRAGDAVRSPLRYLSSLQQADGSFRYSRTSAQTPVWVTAQAVGAVRGKALPVPAPHRKPVSRSRVERSTTARAKARGAHASLRREKRRPAERPAPVRESVNGRLGTAAARYRPTSASSERDREGSGAGWPAAGAAGLVLLTIAWLRIRHVRH